MDLLQALILGIIQGATEYIPVSSTAHLLIAPWLFGWQHAPSFAFDILVQLGTLGAVIVYLRKDLLEILASSLKGLSMRKPLHDEHARKGWMIVVATLPAVVLGLLFKHAIEEAMGSPTEVMIELIVNGAMLCGAEFLARRQGDGAGKPLTFGGAFLVGLGQAVAILPAISRSGATIATAMLLGLRRGEAARFSFLMSVPVMLGAGVLGMKDLLEKPDVLHTEGTGIAVAFGAAAVVGFAVIAWLQAFLRKHSLYGFGIYCAIVGVLGLVLGIGQHAG